MAGGVESVGIQGNQDGLVENTKATGVLDHGAVVDAASGTHDGDVQIILVHVEKKPQISEEAARQAVTALYAILGIMLLAQVFLMLWKSKHRRSYELVTLIGLWLIPAFWSYELSFWRFLVVWVIYSGITLFILSKCLFKTLGASTPGLVYGWFLRVFKLSISVGIGGYSLIFLEVFGLGDVMRNFFPPSTSIDLLWYGLYFGILGRDCAEVASDWMQARIMGGGRKLSVQVNRCGICGGELHDKIDGQTGAEKSIQLDCGHIFHESCIRGWTLVGKKDVCPTCLEKVDLKDLYSDRPWDTSNLSWIKMLDAVRYLVVWNPVIFVIIHFVMHLVGLDKNPDAAVPHHVPQESIAMVQ